MVFLCHLHGLHPPFSEKAMNGFWLNGANYWQLLYISRGVANIHMQMYALCQQKHSRTTKKMHSWSSRHAPDYPGFPQVMGRLANKKYQESRILPPEQGELNDQKQWTQR
jgi:hypothetical protein